MAADHLRYQAPIISGSAGSGWIWSRGADRGGGRSAE
jgi:hypothetical protein